MESIIARYSLFRPLSFSNRSRTRGFGLSPAPALFRSLPLSLSLPSLYPVFPRSFYPSLSLVRDAGARRERFIPYRKKLLGQSRRVDSAKGQRSPGSGPPRVHKDTAIIVL